MRYFPSTFFIVTGGILLGVAFLLPVSPASMEEALVDKISRDGYAICGTLFIVGGMICSYLSRPHPKE